MRVGAFDFDSTVYLLLLDPLQGTRVYLILVSRNSLNCSVCRFFGFGDESKLFLLLQCVHL